MMTIVPETASTLLRRRELAMALTNAGYPISELTLATMATRGGGPPYRKFGRFPLYEWGKALEWAQGRMGPEVRSTAELDHEGVLL